jgi:hypothetical protein
MASIEGRFGFWGMIASAFESREPGRTTRPERLPVTRSDPAKHAGLWLFCIFIEKMH